MADRKLSVRLLGGFGVEVDGRAVPEEAWRQRRAADLVKMLALAPGHRLVRDQVVEALWPALSPEPGASNVRKAAHRARRALGVDDAVVLEDGVVTLLPGGAVITDVERFEAAARHALAESDVGACGAAASLYTGELLPDDLYEPWCAESREQLRRRYVAVLSGAQRWREVVELDPIDERAHREVIRAHLEAGDRPAAIRAFDRMRVALREELGVSPDPESIALYERVLASEGHEVPTPEERARALLAWGVVHWERSELDEAQRVGAEARALAIDAGLGRELADASELLGLVAYAQGAWRELFAATFLDALQRSPHLTPFVVDANMCMSEFAVGEVDGVGTTADLAEELLAVADVEGAQHARAFGLLLRGEAALLGDRDVGRARQDLVAAARLHETMGSTTGQALAVERLAQVEAACGDLNAARRLHDDALRLARHSPVPAHLFPFVYGGMLEGADDASAVAVVDEGEATMASMKVCDPCSMAFHIGVTSVCARVGQLDRARGHLSEAERIAQMWRDGPWHAAVAEARAVLYLAEGGSRPQAATLLEQAAGGFARAARPRDAARCRTAAATLS